MYSLLFVSSKNEIYRMNGVRVLTVIFSAKHASRAYRGRRSFVSDCTCQSSKAEVLNRGEIDPHGFFFGFHGVNCDHSNIHKWNREGKYW